MALSSNQIILFCAIGIIFLARPAHAFGAGNIGSISKVEGVNWRHGDLEDTLLTIVASRAMGGKNFGKLDVKRVYFGNWLRDYSQAVDVGTVKSVSAEAIRILLWVIGFMSFGYGSGEFEVTAERLGCYRPEEHIDNPKDYADNLDARQYDRRLRGPVDERRELTINPETGLKNYIASENMGIDTSAGLVRRLFGRCIQLGRQYARNGNKNDLYEALRLLGTGCHCLEDFSAHSNYVELALIEMGERDIFPHVGRRTTVQLRGARNPVFPVVTGTFGGVDFLHSVCGEFDDKATQSEIQELQVTMEQYQNGPQDGSILQDLLNKIPDGVFGGKDEAGKADELQQNAVAHQMQNTHISPRQPEEWTRYVNNVQKQIYPIIQWHDEVMQSITETIEMIPILPDLIENVQDEINKFVFTLLAPYVVPIINQVKNELNAGSNEIIQSSLDKQHIVFNDDNSSDPTHSMLSKDHFSNILNEPAGKIASQTIKWVVPQLIAAWDDERIDVDRTLNRIINGVLHHPALRDQGQDGASDGRRLMFGVLENWWRGKDEREKGILREQLSRRGVETGMNHKEGVNDHGHGSGKPLGMTNLNQNQSSYPAVQALSAIGSTLNTIGGLGGGGNHSGGYQVGQQGRPSDAFGQMAGAAVGGGALGVLVGGLASGLGSDMLGGGLDENKQTYKRQSYGQDGSRIETVTQIGQSGDRYGQAQYSRIHEPGGGQHEEYNRFEQQRYGGGMQAEVRTEERTSSGQYHEETRRYGSGQYGDDNDRPGDYGRGDEEHSRKHHGHKESNEYERREDHSSKHHDRRDSNEERRHSGEHGRHEGKRHSGGYGAQEGREEKYGGGYGGQQERREEYGGDTYGGRQERREEYGGGEFGGRKERREEYGGGEYGGRQERREEFGGGGEQYGGRQERREEYGGGEYGGRQERREEYGGREERQEYGGRQQEGFGGRYGQQEDENRGGYGSQQGYSQDDRPSREGYGGGGDNDNDNEGYGGRRRGDDDEYSRY